MSMTRAAVVGVLVGVAAVAVPMRATTEEASVGVTFNKDVLPILQKNCQTCHRPGEIAPMSFLTYKDARPWARAMKTAVANRQMPPWFADPAYGHFANDKRLSDADISAISAWADGGAVEGDEKDKPAPVVFQEGWGLKPDMVIEMPQDVLLPASGTINYKSILVKANFTEDRWVVAADLRPGNRAGGAPYAGDRAAARVELDEGRHSRSRLRSRRSGTRTPGRGQRSAGQVQSRTGRAGLQPLRLGEVRAEGIRHRLQHALHGDRQRDDGPLQAGSGVCEESAEAALLHARRSRRPAISPFRPARATRKSCPK